MEFVEEMRCGEVFLTLKGNIIFYCTLCKNKFKGCQEYSEHVNRDHFPILNSEDILFPVSADADSNEEQYEASSCTAKKEIPEMKDAICLPRTSKANKNLRYNCKECHYSTDKKYKFNEHMSHHNNVKPYQCPECVRSFYNSTDLRRHGWIHMIKRKYARSKSENSTKPTQNETATVNENNNCNEEEEMQHLTEIPIPIDKTEDRKYKCTKCGYITKDRSNMWGHIKRHSSYRPHQCELCSKAFYTSTELNSHFRTHTGEKPYLCTECGLTFATSSKLSIHIKYHSNIRDKECPICEMKFFSSTLLRNHMIVHSEERPHECEVCNARFKRQKALKNHLKLHENKREYQCQLCSASFNQRPGLCSHLKSKHAIIKNTSNELLEAGSLVGGEN